MYAQLPPESYGRLKNILEEGKVYLMKRFRCNPYKKSYKVLDAPYMMQFTRFSTAVPQPGAKDEYPYCTYSLTSFTDIQPPGGNNPKFLG